MKLSAPFCIAALLAFGGIPSQSLGGETCLGGILDFSGGGTAETICAGDAFPDPLTVNVTGSSSIDYGFFITDNSGNILGFSIAGTIDLDGAPAGVCRVYGFAYNGALMNDSVGSPVSGVTAANCYELSSNFVTITREVADGGRVDSDQGLNPVICKDGVADPITISNDSTSALNYAYIITDNAGNVLAFPPGDVVDLDGAPAGVCRVYGISYSGALNTTTGVSIGSVSSDGCFELSGNWVEISRVSTEGGVVMHEAGFTNLTICLDADPDPIPMKRLNASPTAPYAYIVTDDSGTVLALPPGDVINLNGAPPGVCRIYGISYAGALGTNLGVQVDAVNSSECWDLSDNYVRVVRENTGPGCDPTPGFSGATEFTTNDTLSVSVKTMYGGTYAVEATESLVSSNWQFVASGIIGNGELQSIELPVNTNESDQYFRLQPTEHPNVGQSAELITRSHGVMGTCTITDPNTLVISDFVFDGAGLNVQVYVSPNPTFSPYTSLSGNLVRPMPYAGETLTFTVPGSIDDVNYISIWCVPVGVSFGDGMFD